MALTAAEREDFINRYEQGPALLRGALEKAPREAQKWRPSENKWSIHEVVCHCADSVLNRNRPCCTPSAFDPANNGAPEAWATPRQSGKATRNTTSPAGPSCFRTLLGFGARGLTEEWLDDMQLSR